MKLKRFFSAFLAAALLAGTVPAALAADIDSHWSKPYVTSLHELGIINPRGLGHALGIHALHQPRV